MLPYYGAVGGTRVPREQNLYKVEAVLEKPTPTQAEQTLIVPGLRSGQYLCFFGMHVLTPTVFDLLASLGESGRQQLSPALGVVLATTSLEASAALHGRQALDSADFAWAFIIAALVVAGSAPLFLRLAREAGAEVSGHQPQPMRSETPSKPANM
jgi:UTP--glucose-1-phosphate uridylyltransferase